MTDRIAFIGIGNIARRIITGLVKSGFEQQRIVVAEHNRQQLEEFCAAYPNMILENSNRQAAASTAMTIICVKPNDMYSVCAEIAPLTKGLLISTAAGVPIACLSEWSGGCRAIVRCMPNTPVSLLKGVVGLYATEGVSDGSRRDVENLFAKIAAVFWLNRESDINVVTALCGSGPGYFLALAEQFAEFACDYGFADTERFVSDVLSHGVKVAARSVGEDTGELIAHCVEYLAECGLSESEDTHMLYVTCLSCLCVFVAGLKKAAVRAGFAPSTVANMVDATLSGSAALAEGEGDVRRLYIQVASKGGTTAEGIKVLKEAKLKQLLVPGTQNNGAASFAKKCSGIEDLAQRMFDAARRRADALEAEISA